MITIIVAYDQNRLIGLDGKLPWNIPAEMKHFKKTTINHTVIMGRKTFDSIGRDLPERRNIVISHRPLVLPAKNEIWSTSLQEAIERTDPENEEVYIIGGEQVYRQALDMNIVDYILASEIKREIYIGNGIANYFPKISWSSKTIQRFKDFNVVEYRRV